MLCLCAVLLASWHDSLQFAAAQQEPALQVLYLALGSLFVLSWGLPPCFCQAPPARMSRRVHFLVPSGGGCTVVLGQWWALCAPGRRQHVGVISMNMLVPGGYRCLVVTASCGNTTWCSTRSCCRVHRACLGVWCNWLQPPAALLRSTGWLPRAFSVITGCRMVAQMCVLRRRD